MRTGNSGGGEGMFGSWIPNIRAILMRIKVACHYCRFSLLQATSDLQVVKISCLSFIGTDALPQTSHE